MEDAGKISLEELLIHREWVARVARALVKGAAADDLEQRVWLRAVTSPPRHGSGLRGWLATLLRRGASDQRREDQRRGRREQIAARPEATPSTADLVARADTHRRVVNAVMSLEEPYRSTILLRWFEDLGPTEIASLRGLPVETVRTRLKRAHALLAEKLDAGHGHDGRNRLLALVSLTGVTAGTGAVLMSIKTTLIAAAAAVLLLAGGGLLLLLATPEPQPPPTPAAALPPPLLPAVEANIPTDTAKPIEVTAPPMLPVSPAPAGANLAVRVVTPEGSGLSGATVMLYPETPAGEEPTEEAPTPAETATTGIDGRTTLTGIAPGRYTVRGTAKGRAPRDERVFLECGSTPTLLILLRPAASLTGTVRSSSGEPLEGVTVTGAAAGSPDSVTDEGGKYALTGLSPGLTQLVAVLPSGVRIRTGSIALPDVEEYDIVIDPGGILKGTVTEAGTGRAISGAEVAVTTGRSSMAAFSASGSVVTGQDGSYRIADLPPESSPRIEVRAEGYAPAFRKAGGQPIVPGLPTREDFELSRGGTVRGTVTLASGEPVADAVVELHSQEMPTKPKTLTGADGTFALHNVPAAAASLSASAPGCWQPGYDWTSAIWRHDECPAGLVVPEGGEVVMDVTLVEGGVVSGTVVDLQGEPVSGVEVFVRPGGGRLGWTTRPKSDELGRIRIGGVHPGDGKTVIALDPRRRLGHYPAASSAPFTLRPGAPFEDVIVVVGPGATLTGHVTDDNGAPVPNATVRFGYHPGGPDRDPTEIARTSRDLSPVGPDGGFRIDRVPAGRIALAAAAPGYADAVAKPFLVADGEVRERLVVVLPRARRLRGTVTDPDGRRLPGAAIRTVSLADSRPAGPGPVVAVSDQNGEFKLTLGPERRLVFASLSGFADGSVQVEADENFVRLTLGRELEIAGIVVDRETGKPIEGIPVAAEPRYADPKLPQRSSITRTGPDGRFTLRRLRPGAYALRINSSRDTRAPNREYVAHAGLVVEAGERGLRVRLEPGLQIFGGVTDQDGRPIANVNVGVVRRGGAPVRMKGVKTDLDGNFRIRQLPRGSYTLSFFDPKSRRGETTGLMITNVDSVKAPAGPLAVVMRRGMAIRGRLMGPNGSAPPEGGYLTARISGEKPGVERTVTPSGVEERAVSGWSAGVRYATDGTFVTPPLDPRYLYDLTATGFPGMEVGQARGVSAGAEGVIVRLSPHSGPSISGTVLDEDGNPAEGVKVLASPERGVRVPSRDATSDASGRFTIVGLSECGYRLAAGTGGDWEFAEMVEARAGARKVVLRTRRLCTFSGRILSQSGEAVRCRVNWVQKYPDGGSRHSSRMTTDREGRFTIRGLRPGAIEITVDLGARKIALGEFTAPAEGVELIAR